MTRCFRIVGAVLMIVALGWSAWAVARFYAPPVPKPHLGKDADEPQARMVAQWGEATLQEKAAYFDLAMNLAAAAGMLLVGGTLVAVSYRRPRG
jgi:hypothetical protein